MSSLFFLNPNCIYRILLLQTRLCETIPFPPIMPTHLQPTIFHSNCAFPTIIPIHFLAVCFTFPHFLHFSFSSLLVFSPLHIFVLKFRLSVPIARKPHQPNGQRTQSPRPLSSYWGFLSTAAVNYQICQCSNAHARTGPSGSCFFCVMYVD